MPRVPRLTSAATVQGCREPACRLHSARKPGFQIRELSLTSQAMKLYFLRHAEALDGMDDAARPLSTRGKKQARQIARFLQQPAIAFDASYTSPLVRARQTAEIVLEMTNKASPVKLELADALLNEFSHRDFNRWLEKLPPARHVLLVGHAPSLSMRVAHLLGLASAAAVQLPKGGLACLDTEDQKTAVLKFLITPKALGM